MTWNLTLEVVDCASTGTKLSGANIEMGAAPLGVTDSAGRFTAQLDDFNTLPIFRVSKTDYVTNNFVFDKAAHAETVQTVCLSNPATIPDGHDPNVPGESGGQEFGNGCFIVTAATGSASSAEVTALRALRERVKARSRLGAELVDAIYGEYERFSPPIAARLGADAAARGLVLRSVVEPLFAWYALAGALALDPDDAELRNRAEAAFGAARPQGDGLGVAGLLEALRGGAPLPPFLPKALVELAPRPDAFPFAAWAILDPLIRIWRGAGKPFAAVAAIGEWLAAAPLERLPRRPGVPDLAIELETVAGFLAFAPERRRELGQRLLAAWPDAAAALARAGLTVQGRTRS